MRTDLGHLPPAKQRELERVVEIVFDEFCEATALATNGWKRKARILKLILYGSYARGGWVDEPHTAKGYKSDYDLLIIVNDKRVTDRVTFWVKLEQRLNDEFAITKTLRTPVSFIVHTLGEVNDGLAHGRYFFMDIAKDGIALYQSDDVELHQPKPKTPAEALAMAREYFDDWYPAAMRRYEFAKFGLEKGHNKETAFELHQTVESLLHTVLLTCRFYTPHTHALGFLRTQAERIDPRLTYVWPRDTRRDRALFEKLKEAYVKARYSASFRIAQDELEWLAARVEELGRVVHAVCSERIEKLAREAGETG